MSDTDSLRPTEECLDEERVEQERRDEEGKHEARGDRANDDGADASSGYRKMATSATQLFTKRVAVQLLSAASTAILARKLGVAGFGAFSAGVAMYYLALSACDFGFGSVLARELGSGRADDGLLVRSMIRVQTMWSGVVGLTVVGFALAVGLGAPRMQVLLVLAPAVALFGLSGVRQVFYAAYQTGRLGVLDVATNVVQLIVVSAVALAGGGPVAVASALSLMIAINVVVIFVAGVRLIDGSPSTRPIRRRMLVDSLPLGVSSLLASAYFTLDLSIVGFLVSSREVGYYAAATKALSLLVTVPGLVITAVLPGLSAEAANPEDLGQLLARVWHWLAAIAVPLCVAVILFAPTFVRLFYGSGFRPAIPLVRILAASGLVAVLSNVFGAALVATRRSRWLVIQGGIALVFNVVGNLLLVPRYGVTASAWLTVLTEVGVCGGAMLGLHRRTVFGPFLRVTVVPLIAVGAMVAVWLATSHWVVLSMISSTVAFAGVLFVLGGWPDELPRLLPQRMVLWRRS